MFFEKTKLLLNFNIVKKTQVAETVKHTIGLLRGLKSVRYKKKVIQYCHASVIFSVFTTVYWCCFVHSVFFYIKQQCAKNNFTRIGYHVLFQKTIDSFHLN